MRIGNGARASSSYQLPTQVLVAAMSVAPTQARIGLINDLITRLILAGVWNKIDVLWVMAAHDNQAARLNWKVPGSFTCAAVNSPTFTTDRGYAGDGTTSYLTPTWNPSTSGVSYTLNSAHIGAWTITNAAVNSSSTGSSNNFLRTRSSTNTIQFRLNNSTTLNSTTTHTVAGHSVVTRPNSANVNAWQNGTQLGTTIAAASVAIPAVTQFLLGQNNAGVLGAGSTKQTAAVHYGGDLSATEVAALYSALNTYMVAVGAA